MLRSGFLTNALNPKTCLFVVSLFMQVIDPHTALPAQLGYGAFIALAHVAWFGLVACFLSSPAVRGRSCVSAAHRPVLRRPAGRFRRPAGGEKPMSMDH